MSNTSSQLLRCADPWPQRTTFESSLRTDDAVHGYAYCTTTHGRMASVFHHCCCRGKGVVPISDFRFPHGLSRICRGARIGRRSGLLADLGLLGLETSINRPYFLIRIAAGAAGLHRLWMVCLTYFWSQRGGHVLRDWRLNYWRKVDK